MSGPDSNGDKNVNTGGGTYVGGDTNTEGGDFVGRDKKVYFLGISVQIWIAFFITLIIVAIIGFFGKILPTQMEIRSTQTAEVRQTA